jgi:opacity protein-like surface antigen
MPANTPIFRRKPALFARAHFIAGIVAFGFVFLQSPALFAQPCDTLGRKCPTAMHAETARGLGLGTGSRASAVSTSALAYNPAALVMGRLYHVEASVDYMPEFDAVALGGAVVDSSTSKVAAGLALRGFLSGREGLGGLDGRLGIAFPFSDAVSIGLGGRYITMSSDDEVPDPSDPGETLVDETELAQGFTMDVGLRVQAADMLHFTLATFNFVDLDTAYVPVLVSTGVALGLGSIGSLGFDMLTDLTSYEKATYTLGGGVEILAGNQIPLRGGYSVDTERKIQWVTGGIGYTDRWLGFDLSVRQGVSGNSETRVLGAVKYYVH